MKKHKKIFTAIISMVLVIAMVGTYCAFANDNATKPNGFTNQHVSINEYEAIKQLSNKSTDDLEKSGYSSEDITKIRNYKQVFNSHILMLQELSEEVLTKHGYSKEQINVINNFTGSDEQMSIASASIYIYATTALFEYPNSTDRTSGRLAYGWSWSGVPAFKLTDIVAASWNSWNLTGQSAYVSYYGVNSGTYYTSGTPTFTSPTNSYWNGGGHKIDVEINDNYYYAKLGGGTFDVESDGLYQKDFYYYIEYGHSYIYPTISFSVSVPGGASGSISLSSGVTCEGSCSGSYYW